MLSQQDILPSKIREPINNIILQENFTTYSINIKNIQADSNFLGELREIYIKGETENGSKELNLFTKTLIDDVDLIVSSVPRAYKNEAYIYNELGKVIYEVQEESKVPVEKRYTFAKSFESTDFNTIVLENLSVKGFSVCAIEEIIPLKFAELAIEKLAKLHSFAFIVKEKRPIFFEERVRNMKQPFFYGKKIFIDFVKKLSSISLEILHPEQRKKIEEFLPTTYDKYEKYTQDSSCTWTLVHGDFRASNVMAKFNENSEATEVIIIDYQHTFYGCSIIDLIYFIVAGTDQEFRKSHMEHIKNFYYESMSNFLKLFDMDIKKYYPREEYERLYKERLDYGLMVALWLIPLIFTKSDAPGKLSDAIQKRIRDIVDDYIQWGYV